MWPFAKKISVSKSCVFDGMTDVHCHLLPGVDDGVQSLKESIEILQLMEEEGVRKLWLTPHVMEDIPNETVLLKRKFEEVKRSYQGSIELRLAAEYMMDNLFLERLHQGDLLPLNEGKPYLLVETSYFNPPMDLKNILSLIKKKGYFPLLAHPERYVYMEWSYYKELKDEQIAFQLNMPSLVGRYGKKVQEKAETLLKASMYDFIGCDTHAKTGYVNLLSAEYAKKISQLIMDNVLGSV